MGGKAMQYLFGMGPGMSTSSNPLKALESNFTGKSDIPGLSTAANPAMLSFQNGSTTLLAGSQALLSAATAVQGMAGMGGGGGIPGLGGMSSGMTSGDSTFGGAGSNGNPFMGSDEGGSLPIGMATMSGGTGSFPLTSGNPMLAQSAIATGYGSSSNSKIGSEIMGVGAGAFTAGTGIYNAYQNSDPVSGVIGGGVGGAEIGASVGGPIGAVIGGLAGAIAGGIAGALGDKGRGHAQDLDTNTIQPALKKDLQDYEAGRAGYNTLAGELNQMMISAQTSTTTMGSGARSYYTQNIVPEINAVLTALQRQEIGGRSAITMSAAQFHSGGMIGGFGDLATSDTEGFIHAMQNEFVVNPIASAAHAPLLSAINAGNVSYSNTVQPRMPASSAGGMVTLNIQALDSKSVAAWAKAGGGLALMAALNQAQRQYSGVGRG
jgi:hypothetical protein